MGGHANIPKLESRYHKLVSPLEGGTVVLKQKMNCKGPSFSDVIQEYYVGSKIAVEPFD